LVLLAPGRGAARGVAAAGAAAGRARGRRETEVARGRQVARRVLGLYAEVIRGARAEAGETLGVRRHGRRVEHGRGPVGGRGAVVYLAVGSLVGSPGDGRRAL